MHSDEDDLDLIDKYRAGDQEAFAAFYRKYWVQLGSVLARIIRNLDEAQDLLQTAFQQFIEYALSPRYSRGRGSVRAFLFQIARNLAMNGVRDRSIAKRGNLWWAAEYVRKAISRSLEEEIQTEDEFRTTFRGIPEEDMELLTFRYVDDFSYEEISIITDIPARTVAYRIESIVERVRELRKRRQQTEAADE